MTTRRILSTIALQCRSSFARSKRANVFAAVEAHRASTLSGSALRIAFSRYALSEKAGRSEQKKPRALLRALHLTRDSRFNTLNLACLNAFYAHTKANIFAINGGANWLKVRAEGALIANVRM